MKKNNKRNYKYRGNNEIMKPCQVKTNNACN